MLAYILACNLMLFGLNGIINIHDHATSHVEMAGESDCCTGDHDSDRDDQHAGHDHTCPSGCDCCCCYHMVAIEYQLKESAAGLPLIDHICALHDDYQFQFTTHLFHPPRIG